MSFYLEMFEVENEVLFTLENAKSQYSNKQSYQLVNLEQKFGLILGSLYNA